MPSSRYSHTAILLHWLVALLALANWPLGRYVHELTFSPEKLRLISYHKWIGVTVFLLMLLRLAWRFGHRPPALPAAMHQWEKTAATAVHHALYLLLLLIPLSGWLMSSAKGIQTVWLGWLPLPDLIGKHAATADLLQAVHLSLNLLFALLLLLHVGAALKHQFIARDGILARMLPFTGDHR